MALGMAAFFPIVGALHPDSVSETAARLASLLTGGSGGLRDPGGGELVFESSLALQGLARGAPPPDVWAVDGGQALVADARCVQVYATRAARVRWGSGRSVVEDSGELRLHVLGLGESRRSLAALVASGAPVASDASVDVNLLRDWDEWSAVSACVGLSEPGGVVLVDGDLQPDWRIPASWLGSLLESARDRGVMLVGVTKHSSLSYNGAPLLGLLERMASSSLGPRAMWWVPVARTRPDVGPGLQVVVARLDADARFSFRVDLPGDVSPEPVLASLSALCDDAAFPGYPYPLSVADRLAACPSWVRDELWAQISEGLDRAGVDAEVQERAFADRHRLMERS
jgi:hypothetical protein